MTSGFKCYKIEAVVRVYEVKTVDQSEHIKHFQVLPRAAGTPTNMRK